MANEFSRAKRVSDQIQKQLALLIQQEVKDPRVGMVTVTAVNMSREFDHARVYITSMDGKENIKETLEGLNRAAGFLRSELAKRIKLRTTPKLNFVYDTSVEDGNRLTALINQAVKSNSQDSQKDD